MNSLTAVSDVWTKKTSDSDSNISTYSFADYCNTLVIYSTKMGMEFAPYGNKIIVVGESYIKNKDITLDPKTQEEYYNLLNMFRRAYKYDEDEHHDGGSESEEYDDDNYSKLTKFNVNQSDDDDDDDNEETKKPHFCKRFFRGLWKVIIFLI